MREGEGAFGDPTVFIEQAVVDPRHIEVQILADGAGNVIHLFERDCSVQRRHQKVVEIAPAPNLDPAIRERMCADAVRFAPRSATATPAPSSSCSTRRQLRLHRDEPAHPGRAHGDRGGHRRRPRAGADADRLRGDPRRPRALAGQRPLRGAALQCRITTEDPANGFRPDTGKITTYRSPGGAGVRLDGGTIYTGAEVSAHFDSMLGQAHLPRARRSRRPSTGPAARSPSSASAASPRTSRSCRRCSTTRTSGRPAHHVVHRATPAAARRAVSGRPRHQAAAPTSPTSPSTSRTGRRRSASTR